MLLSVIFLQSDTNTVHFRSVYLEYLADSNRVILMDSAHVRRGNVQLFADTIIYYTDIKEVIARGEFKLLIDTNTITGDSLRYMLDEGRGIAYHTRNYIQKGWLYSGELYKLGGDTLAIKGGRFTTCDLPSPHYAFHGRDMLAINDEMAFVRHVVLRIMGIPILYAPFWMFPLKRERSSGFLTPNFGFTTLDGKYVRNLGYYWVLNNYADITLYMDIVEKRGLRTGVRFVYNIYRLMSGNINFNFSNDFLIKQVRRRYALDATHQQNLMGWKVSARANIVSDRTYFQDYAENKDQWLKTQTYSYIQTGKAFSWGNLSMNADYHKNLITGEYRSNLPSISISFKTLNIQGISISQSISFLNTYRGDTLKDYRNMSFSHRLNFNRTFSFGSILSIPHNLSFSTSISGDSLFRGRTDMAYSTSLSTTIYGRSIFSFWKIERFYHDLTPSVGIRYSRPVLFINNDSLSKVLAPSFSYTYGLKNQFAAKVNEKRISLGSLNFSGSYNPADTARPFSPLSISLSLPSVAGISAGARTTYDYYTGKLGDISGNISFRWKVMGINLSGGVVFPQKTLNIRASGRLTENWAFSYSLNRNLETGEIFGQNLSLTRQLHRWEAVFRWSEVGPFASYDIRIYLKDIPELKVTRGMLNLFLPDVAP